MKLTVLLLIFISISSISSGQQKNSELSIIPEPVSIIRKNSEFVLGKQVNIFYSSTGPEDNTLDYIKNKISTATGAQTKITPPNLAQIELNLLKEFNPVLGSEGYTLSIKPNKITINANKTAGIFYGFQSLIQLFPAEIESSETVNGIQWKVPCVEIIDYPKLSWRGLMLDVSRHFFTINEVKRYVDEMAKYKYNILHLHMTNDEGWRLEIKSYPKLTEVGAWRVEKIGHHGRFSNPLPDEPKTYGGFYTQEDIKGLISYAKARHVEILPEIDVPGHSLAAIVSYPEFSCTEGADQYMVRAGEPIIDWSKGRPIHSLVDNTLCPANENVYEFLDKVFDEVALLFPFQYIHVGGDEAAHNFWRISPAVSELMARENLKSYTEVQAYFEKRVEEIILSKGKKMIGWDEILEGKIGTNTALMCWREKKYAIDATKAGHCIVMSPTSHVYIDQRQGDLVTEPQMNRAIRLNRAYEFDPLPTGVDEKYVLGGQANLWTENVYNFRQVQYQTWPRGFAISERLWSPNEKKNWEKFAKKTENHFKRLDMADIKYSPAIYDPIITIFKNEENYYVKLSTEIEGLDIYTTFDNSTPDRFYPKYNEPLLVPKDANMLRIITYRGKKPVGRLMSITVEDIKNRVH